MSQNKLHVKKGDTVKVLSGKDKGKQAKVIKAMPADSTVLVEGVNQVKRHTKPSVKDPNGGIITKEAPIHASNVMVVCPACKKATRVAKKEVEGKMIRICKHCGEALDQAK